MDRKVFHLQTTTVNFRPSSVQRSRDAVSPRRERMTRNPKRDNFRCWVNSDRDKMGGYDVRSGHDHHGQSGQTNHRPNVPREKKPRYWLQDRVARPIYRTQSAPMKYSRTNKAGRWRSQRSSETNSRPQTVAPFVNQLEETEETNCDFFGEVDSMSMKASSSNRNSDKHGRLTPYKGDNLAGHVTYDSRIVMGQGHCTDETGLNSGIVYRNGCIMSNSSEDRLKAPTRVTFEHVDWIRCPDNSENDDEDSVLSSSDIIAHIGGNKDTSEEKPNDAEILLLNNGNASKDSHNISDCSPNIEHEALIDRIRQSYGVLVETTQTDGVDVKPTAHVSMATDYPTGRYAAMNKGESRRLQITHLTGTRSALQEAPLLRGGAGHGVLVKHLKERRRRTPNRQKECPDVDSQPKVVIEETKPLRRNHHVNMLPTRFLCKREFKVLVSGLFLRTSTFVWYVCRLLGAMIDLSAEMTTRSATEGQWHALHTSREARDMAFNKAAFAKSKDATRVPLWAKRIMRKEPDERTEQEVKRVHALLRGMKSFDRFTEKIQLSMCKSFVYYKITSGRVILRQGHVGQNFYFLFTGSVFVNIDDVDGKGNQFSKTEAILTRGDSFGELALLQDIRRTATITCREDCEMLVVDKDTFAQICPRIFELELEEKIAFVSKMKLFNLTLWDEDSLRKMCFEAQIQEYKTNKVVVVDSEKDDWIYICMEGKCQVIRRLDLFEEIAWRKLHQQKLGSSSPQSSRQDYMTVITQTNLTLRSKQTAGRRRSVSSAVKENLLESMGLDYTQKRRAQHMRERRASSKDDLSTSLHHRGVHGPLTLTSLLASDERANGNHLYLNIHVLQQGDVFDLPSVLSSQEEMETTAGSHLLVSLGSRLLRIKRTSYFKYASQEAIDLARGLALKYMYPSDDVLLQRYRDFLHWEVYKYQVLQVALSQRRPNDGNTCSNRVPGKPTTRRNTGRELFQHNKSTLSELNSIFNNEDETNTDEHSKQVDELKFINCPEWQKRQNEQISKKLPSLNQEQSNDKLNLAKCMNRTKLDVKPAGSMVRSEPRDGSNSGEIFNRKQNNDKLENGEMLNQSSSNDNDTKQLLHAPKKNTCTPNRRVSRVTVATEFNTIVEIDE